MSNVAVFMTFFLTCWLDQTNVPTCCLTRAETSCVLMSERAESSFDSQNGNPALLASLMGENNWESLEENYRQTTTRIRNVYNKEFRV